MLNTSRCARSMVAVVWMAGIHCDTHKATSTASTSTPLAKEDGGAELSAKPAAAQPAASTEPPKPAKDAGPPDWYTCKKAEECTVVYEDGCCLPDCDPLSFAGYTAVNAKHRADFMGHIGCSESKCACPIPPQDIPRSDSNFFALCQQGRCVAVDLRFSKYSQCKTLKDCALRFGLGCCEGCGDKDLVTYNPASTLAAELCPTKPKCPPVTPACLARRSPHQNAECVLNQCQLSD